MGGALRCPGSRQRSRRPALDGVGEDGPVVDVLLPAEVRLRALNGFREARGLDGEQGLAGTVFMAGIIANGFDKTDVE